MRQKYSKTIVKLDILSSQHGDDSRIITEGDDTPLKRAELAEQIIKLIRSGHFVSLSDGSKVIGYNAATNEWIIDGVKEGVAAAEKPATALSPVAGG